MDRTLQVSIERRSWPPHPQHPRFPQAFRGVRNITLSVPLVLLKIGYLTTPASSSGVSLSEFWAWVRYLAAITDEADLRLTSSFANLDAHQKTILSDDFGMGVPMSWLDNALNFRTVCDGRYFLDRFGASAGATVRKKAKRGPNKTPDFVARDSRGIWHVVECKGTQSGTAYSATQIGKPGPPATGGIAQKQSIIFPPGHTGQRLVCALSIAIEDTPSSSRLTIVDPEPEDPVTVELDQLEFAEDAAERATVAKALRLAGFDSTADVTAAPFGRFASSYPRGRGAVEESRRKVVEEREAAARNELAQEEHGTAWKTGGSEFRGRETSILLPRTLRIAGTIVERAVVRQGVNAAVLSEMRSRTLVEDLVSTANLDWSEAIGQTETETDSLFAAMQIGDLFRSEIILE